MNFARIGPDSLIIAPAGNARALKMADADKFAVGIMPITVTESYLYSGVMGGPGLVQRVTGVPFCQEYRRDVSIWGTKLEFPPEGLRTSVGSAGISFTTRWEKGPHFEGASTVFHLLPRIVAVLSLMHRLC